MCANACSARGDTWHKMTDELMVKYKPLISSSAPRPI